MRFVVVLVLALVGVARAEPGRVEVSLHDALVAARKAPAALVGGYEVAAADANVAAAAAWPAPGIHLGTNRLTARLIAGATLPLPVFGTVGAAKRQAAAEADVVRADTELVRRELRHRVVAVWVQLARADGDVVATSITAQQAAELELIAKGRLDAGTGADVDVTVAGAARARAEVAAKVAQRVAETASAELAGALGWDPSQRLGAVGAMLTGDMVELDTMRTHLAAHPERAAALKRLEAADAGLDQVLAQRWPSLAVEGEILWDDQTLEPFGKTDAHVGIVLDLPIFSRIGDKARSARATEAAQRARLVVTETELGAGLVATYKTWQAATERLQALEHDIVPAQERAAALSAQAYREGARDLAFALQAARDLAAVRAEVNTARADAAIAFADLQLAAGEEPGAEK